MLDVKSLRDRPQLAAIELLTQATKTTVVAPIDKRAHTTTIDDARQPVGATERQPVCVETVARGD